MVNRPSAVESKVLEFNTMIRVPRPYTRTTNAIHHIPGGGLPWVIAFGKGKLSPDGSVNVLVKGLVIETNDPTAIATGRAGTNPSPTLKVMVSCLNKDAR
jgi:hypothetical protein